MLRRLLASLAGIGLIIGVLFAAPSAAVAADGDVGWCPPAGVCYSGGTPETPPGETPPGETVGGGGPPVCVRTYLGKEHVIDCDGGSAGSWSNAHGCFIARTEQQVAPPVGEDAALGAWYTCTPGDVVGDARPTTQVWIDGAPVPNITPGEAAAQLVGGFQLQGIDIGLAPDPAAPGASAYVGVPVWMWVENPTPLSYGPYTESAAIAGFAVTATARVASVQWTMGDGRTVTCGAGTAYSTARGLVDSPDCGHRYSAVSGGGSFAVTATSQWRVEWSAGGQTGVIPIQTQSTTDLAVRELQSVNVGG